MFQNSATGRKNLFVDPSEHPPLGPGSYNSVIQERNVTKIIDSAGVCFKGQFLGMDFKKQMFSEKTFDFITVIDKQFFIFMHKNKIIGVTDITLDSQLVFNELIKFVHINVCEQLQGQIASGRPGLKLSIVYRKRFMKRSSSVLFERIFCLAMVPSTFVSGIDYFVSEVKSSYP
jgi:hypothetical protein